MASMPLWLLWRSRPGVDSIFSYLVLSFARAFWLLVFASRHISDNAARPERATTGRPRFPTRAVQAVSSRLVRLAEIVCFAQGFFAAFKRFHLILVLA